MHAGDGNVHTNIPVNSDDYGMLQEANAAVARIMALARSLGGVISGEHGIGITKLEYLTDDELAPFAQYKTAIDPHGRFNRGKLLRDAALPADLSGAYTPSFSLIGHESLILEQSEIGDVADSIKDCLRCGKCKPVCATHVAARQPALQPAQQDPRDVAADRGVPVRGADAPRRQPPPLRRVRRRRRPLHRLPQVREPVPGRHRLRRRVDRDAQPAAPRRAQRKFNPGTAASMFFLNATDPADDQARRKTVMIDWGYKAQRLALSAGEDAGVAQAQTRRPPPTVGKRRSRRRSSTSSTSRCRAACRSARRARCSTSRTTRVVPIIRDPRKVDRGVRRGVLLSRAAARSGCSRRWASPRRRCCTTSGAQTVLPPGYLCCGYPQTVGGQPRRGPADHHRQPRAVPPRRQHAQLSRHQDGDRVVRHVHGPARRSTSSTRSSPAAACSTSTST